MTDKEILEELDKLIAEFEKDLASSRIYDAENAIRTIETSEDNKPLG